MNDRPNERSSPCLLPAAAAPVSYVDLTYSLRLRLDKIAHERSSHGFPRFSSLSIRQVSGPPSYVHCEIIVIAHRHPLCHCPPMDDRRPFVVHPRKHLRASNWGTVGTLNFNTNTIPCRPYRVLLYLDHLTLNPESPSQIPSPQDPSDLTFSYPLYLLTLAGRTSPPSPLSPFESSN